MGRSRPPLLIGLGGKLRSGKDALADHLVENYGYVKMGMSDPLNNALLTLDPLIPIPPTKPGFSTTYAPYSELHRQVGYVEAKKNPEVRRLLQKLGTDVGRNMISNDVWVNMASQRIRLNIEKKIPTVITALRFPNELRMLSKLSGLSVWVERPPGHSEALEGPYSPVQSDIGSHASENSVHAGLFDTEILNYGTLEELYSVTDRMISRIRHGGMNSVKGFRYNSILTKGSQKIV